MEVCFSKMGVCFTKMRVCFTKMGVCIFENGSLFFENGSLFSRKWEGFLMMKMIDRPNTTPIGQDSASQWCNVTFSLLICLKLDLVILCVVDGISV